MNSCSCVEEEGGADARGKRHAAHGAAARKRESLRVYAKRSTLRGAAGPRCCTSDDAAPHPPERRQRNEFINEHCFSDELGPYTEIQADRQAGRHLKSTCRHLGAEYWGKLGRCRLPRGRPGHAFGFQRTLSAGRQAAAFTQFTRQPCASAHIHPTYPSA